MAYFVTRRLVLVLVTLWLVSLIVFVSAQVLPGDVAASILGQYATPDQLMQLNHELGMDRPVLARYWRWLTEFIRGDWGVSPILNTPVRPIVLERLRNSLYLSALAFATIPLWILAGVSAALKAGGAIDRAIVTIAMMTVAIPEFVVGIVLLVVFSVQLGWFPVGSAVPDGTPADVVRQLLLPALTVSGVIGCYIARMARTGVIDALAADYTRTATLKGLSRGLVVWRHVLRNGLLPTVTVIAMLVGYLIGGLVVVETLFNYPGIGRLAFEAANTNDLPMLQATAMMIATIYMVALFVGDLCAMWLNPRLRIYDR